MGIASLLTVVYENTMIKGIIFDLGRTLIYSKEKRRIVDQEATAAMLAYLNANGITPEQKFLTNFRIAREQGLRIAENTHFEQKMEIALRGALKLTNKSECVSERILQRAVDVYYEVYEQYWLVYSDTIEVLNRLSVLGMRLGAISNFEKDNMMRRVLDRFGISPYLSPIITSAMVNWRKPRPDIFQLVSQEWELNPHEIVMVGDSLRDDIGGAHSSGMRGILICRHKKAGINGTENCRYNHIEIKPDAIISSLEEVQEVVTRME